MNSFISSLRRLKISLFRIPFMRDARNNKHLIAWSKNPQSAVSSVPPIVKQTMIKDLADHFKIKHLVETGTYLGDMIFATKNVFDRIDSIELNKTFQENAIARFKDFPHIKIWQGDSPEILPLILKETSSPILFWLDAHYSGGETAKSDKGETPIEKELEVVFGAWNPKSIIMIDDARLFNGTKDYPTMAKLSDLLAGPYAHLNLALFTNFDTIVIKDRYER